MITTEEILVIEKFVWKQHFFLCILLVCDCALRARACPMYCLQREYRERIAPIATKYLRDGWGNFDREKSKMLRELFSTTYNNLVKFCVGPLSL